MLNAKDYLNQISLTPKESYQNIIQATLNSEWEDTTQIYKIKEQIAYPFIDDEYNEIEVYLDTISDDMINTSKVYSDFVRIIFNDAHYKQNYKGQYYKIKIDDESNEEYYICYDRINRLSQLAETKVVRCNNVLTLVDENGNIIEIPCYLGTDITSTNNQVSKKATVPNARMIIFVQANKYTMNIRKNKRLMFQHSGCFRVEETNNYMQEQGTNGEVTCVKIYVDYDTLLPTDNVDLNICDFYKNNYSIEINQKEIYQKNGFIGSLNAIVKDSQDNILNVPIVWSTTDENVVSIDNYGNYIINGNFGDYAKIKCCMLNNESIFDEVEINVVNDYLPDKEIIVNPNEDTYIKQGREKMFYCGVYINGEKQSDKISCIGSNVDKKCYEIIETIDGFIVKNNKLSEKPLILTFSSNDCDDVVIKIELKGVV